MIRFRLRPLVALCAIAAAVVLIAADADARAGRGGNVGSRGTQTNSAPPTTTTTTAPNAARPMERSMSQPSQPSSAARPATAPNPTGFLGRTGFLGGLFAGFLGAGLLGMLFGHGLTTGLGSFASILGLLLQIGIVALIAYLLWTWWQRRSQPAVASGPALRDMPPESSHPIMGFGSLGSHQPAARASGSDEIGLTPDDFNTFERLLGEVQVLYGKEDLHALRSLATPEMVSYFSEDLAEDASRGVVNKVSDVKLLQGDLAEAWREGATDYASVAIRYAINVQTVERASGRVLEGGPDEVTEVTEVWTFMRAHGGAWLLSAIQQA